MIDRPTGRDIRSEHPPETGGGWLMCFSCCPPSERRWFRWVILGQPVLALGLLIAAQNGWL